MWESHVTWGTPVQSFVFLGLLVFELEPMYATSDRQTMDADHRLMPPRRGHNKRLHRLHNDDVAVSTAYSNVHAGCCVRMLPPVDIMQYHIAVEEFENRSVFRFYRATRMHSTDYAVTRCPSVCLSVTRRYSVDTTEHIFKLLLP